MIIIIIIIICCSAVSGETPPENPYMMPSTKTDLLPPSEGMHEALFIINNANNFIKEVLFIILHCVLYIHVVGTTYYIHYTFTLCTLCAGSWYMYTDTCTLL